MMLLARNAIPLNHSDLDKVETIPRKMQVSENGMGVWSLHVQVLSLKSQTCSVLNAAGSTSPRNLVARWLVNEILPWILPFCCFGGY